MCARGREVYTGTTHAQDTHLDAVLFNACARGFRRDSGQAPDEGIQRQHGKGTEEQYNDGTHMPNG